MIHILNVLLGLALGLWIGFKLGTKGSLGFAIGIIWTTYLAFVVWMNSQK